MGKAHSITIGDMIFNSKSQAIDFYKNILNSYSAENEEELNSEDFKSVLALYQKNVTETEENSLEKIDKIIVAYHPDYKSTKCFHFVRGDFLYVFSYRLSIKGALTDKEQFSRACRYAVKEHLRSFKMQHFRNKPVKCAVTNEIVEWEECQIDHKAPLTFSVIVKSFIVANNIILEDVEYNFDNLVVRFASEELANKFCEFHSKMAVLRILSTGSNSRLSASARITPTKKDSVLSDFVQKKV